MPYEGRGYIWDVEIFADISRITVGGADIVDAATTAESQICNSAPSLIDWFEMLHGRGAGTSFYKIGQSHAHAYFDATLQYKKNAHEYGYHVVTGKLPERRTTNITEAHLYNTNTDGSIDENEYLTQVLKLSQEREYKYKRIGYTNGSTPGNEIDGYKSNRLLLARWTDLPKKGTWGLPIFLMPHGCTVRITLRTDQF